MFSPVSQTSNPSSPFFSLSPPFISSFTPFHHFGVLIPTVLFQLNLGLSMDSATFVISFISLSSSIISSSIYSFISLSFINLAYNSLTSLPSDVFNGLSSLFQFSSFPLISSFPFHSLSSLSSSISLFQQSFLSSLFHLHWSLFPHLASFPFHSIVIPLSSSLSHSLFTTTV